MSAPDITDIHSLREGAKTFSATAPRFRPGLPRGTFARIAVPAESGVEELMLYRPAGRTGPLPVFVNLHGGGFVIGDWQFDDPYCRLLADTAGCAVVNLDYLLAPENPFPAAVEQTYSLLVWLHGHGAELGLDGDRLAVGGHSAGGNLSTAAALLSTERGDLSLRGQIIDYAPLDLATNPRDKPVPGPAGDPELAEFLTRTAEQYNAWYLLDPADATCPLASPVLAPNLETMPATLVITAEDDVLCAEGDVYARLLRDAGVPTEYVSYPGCSHAFTHHGPDDAAADAWDRMGRFLARVLA